MAVPVAWRLLGDLLTRDEWVGGRVEVGVCLVVWEVFV